MRFGLLTASLAGVASVASEHNPEVEFAVKEAPPFPHDKYAKLGLYEPKPSFPQDPSSKTQVLQDLDGLHSGYAESFNEIDDTDMPLSKSANESPDKKQTKSPAMSALTLMGFLSFLNLIQDVLEGKTGREKREVRTPDLNNKEGIQDYLFAYEDLAERVAKAIPQGGADGRGFNELMDYLKFSSDNSFEGRTLGFFSYLSSFMNRIMQVFGLGKDASSRHDQNVGETAGPGFWSIFGERIGLIARIMDFLNDPSPSRIGRSYHELDQTEANPKEEYAEAKDLSEEEKGFLPPDRTLEEKSHSRKKRFSVDDMNIWYSEAYGSPHTKPPPEERQQRIIGMVLNLLRGIQES